MSAQLLKKCENNVKKIAVVGNTGRLSQQERVSQTAKQPTTRTPLLSRGPSIPAPSDPLCSVLLLICVGLPPSLRCFVGQSVRLNVMRSLATELQTHSKTFRTAQKDFLKR